MSEQRSAATEAAEIVERLAQAKSRQDVGEAMEIYRPDEVRVDGHGLDGDTMCCWGETSFTPAFTWGGAIPNGNRATVPVFMLFRFRDGRIAYESFHFDVSGVARQCGVDASELVRAA